MEEIDNEILNEIQWTFPLVSRPFDEIAKKFSISSDEVKSRLTKMRERGVLRPVSYTHLTLPTIYSV